MLKVSQCKSCNCSQCRDKWCLRTYAVFIKSDAFAPALLGIQPAPARLSGTPQKPKKGLACESTMGEEFESGKLWWRKYTLIHMLYRCTYVNIHVYIYNVYYTCILTFLEQKRAPLQTGDPLDLATSSPLGIWNGSDLKNDWQNRENCFGALSFSKLGRECPAFSLTPLPGGTHPGVQQVPHQIWGPWQKRNVLGSNLTVCRARLRFSGVILLIKPLGEALSVEVFFFCIFAGPACFGFPFLINKPCDHLSPRHGLHYMVVSQVIGVPPSSIIHFY